MACNDFFQPHIDWLLNSPPLNTPGFHIVHFVIGGLDGDGVGNYAEGDFLGFDSQNQRFSGQANLFFSDRRTPTGQPFDQNQTDFVSADLSTPDGPLQFYNIQTNAIITQFSIVECRGDGLLILSFDFGVSVLVMGFKDIAVG